MSLESFTAKDFAHAVSAAVNTPAVSSKRKEFGETIFKNIPKERLVEYFVGLVHHVSENKRLVLLTVKGDLNPIHLIVQGFFAWLAYLKHGNNNQRDDPSDAVKKDEVLPGSTDSSPKPKRKLSRANSNAIRFTDEEKKQIIETIAVLEFPSTVKMLQFSCKTLDMNPETVVAIVKNLADAGKASFSSLVLTLSEPIFNSYVWPELLMECLLTGKVTAMQIESYASKLGEKERQTARETVIAVEMLCKSAFDYNKAFVTYTHRDLTTKLPFDVFRNNTLALMNDLRHRNQRRPVDQQALYGYIKNTVFKRYKKQELNNEQLLDVVVYVLKIYPQLKKFICKEVEKNDKDMASRIRVLDLRRSDQLPVADVDFFEIREKYLSLPPNTRINMVTRVAQLCVVLNSIDLASSSDFPFVGLDAEWSPFATKPKAAILQIAFRESVYILDMDSLNSSSEASKELQKFFNNLFGNKKLCKIGFRFSEDLAQLRGVSPDSRGLYAPENLICIQKLLQDVVTECVEKKVDLDSLIIFSKEQPFMPSPEIAELEAELADPAFDENDLIRSREKLCELIEGYKERDILRKSELEKDQKGITQIFNTGLAGVCARLFGKTLDKSEQCSAWERRPLRKSQLRYAALDAYCILMILNKVIEFCTSKNMDVLSLTKKQPKITYQVPLFFNPSS